MNKNTHVETAQKGQATNKNTQPEKVVTALKNIDDIRKNKSKVPTGKVTLLKESETRKKTREEQYRNFRINALKRRCKRMGFDDEKTAQYVEALKKQLDAPKEYAILVHVNQEFPREKLKEGEIFKSSMDAFIEDLNKAGIKYNFKGSNYVHLSGDQNVLAKIREIAPPSAKIHPYAKKMESVLKDVERPPQEKKPTKNTAAVKAAVKQKKKELNLHRCKHKKGKGKVVAKQQRKISLSERKKLRKATVVQLNTKKSSTASKKASTPIKKAA